MKRMILEATCALAIIATAGVARAADITRTYSVTASDFESFPYGLGPIQSFAATYQLTFDPTTDHSRTTDGLTVVENTFPSTTAYAYTSSADRLTIGTVPSEGFYLEEAGDYGLFIVGATTINPTVELVGYNVDGVPYGASVAAVTASPITSAAPEPSTWALMIAGMSMAGTALRFGRRSVQPTAPV